MSKNSKPKRRGKARAEAIRAEIDKLTRGAPKDEAPPASPRDYIQRWMAEHDKKPDGK